MGEHGFAEKHPAEVDAVGAANQLPLIENLCGMGDAMLVESAIVVDDVGGNPCAVLTVPFGKGTAEDNFIECRVKPDLPWPIVVHAFMDLLELLFQAVGDDEPVGWEHHAGGGAPPHDWVAITVPGENAMPISPNQLFGRHFSAECEQSLDAFFSGCL